MKDEVIKFRSVTQAMKAKKILASLGIKSNIERMTSNEYGCGYQLKSNSDNDKIKQILLSKNIQFIR